MKDFDQALYEGTLVALGKILSKYNAFAQGSILKDAGEELYKYLQQQGFSIDEKGTLDDLSNLIDLFANNGFAEKLEIKPADKGAYYIWHELLLLDAYKELQDTTGSPFISCPLNLCMFYLADKHGKQMQLIDKTFDMNKRLTISQWDVIDSEEICGDKFDALVIENARLYELAQERADSLEKARKEIESYAEKLQASNRELQDFAYVASHDLQEPLRKIQAFGDRLRAKFSETLDEKGLDYLERMQNAASRMQQLINDLLTYSRLTTKAKPFSAVDLNEIAKEVVSDLEIRIEDVKGKVEIDKLPVTEVDSTQIRQLMQNLIGNALKFHKDDETPVVKVYSESDDEQNDVYRIIVEDNGIGFDPKHTDRIFGVFQRLHGREKYEGTGIGLAVCRKIVERHGGTISAASAPGQGTKFSFTLPAKLREES